MSKRQILPAFCIVFLLFVGAFCLRNWSIVVALNILAVFVLSVIYTRRSVFFTVFVLAQFMAAVCVSLAFADFFQDWKAFETEAVVMQKEQSSYGQRVLFLSENEGAPDKFYAYVPFTVADIGDTVRVSCKPEDPKELDRGYRFYLASQGVALICGQAEVTVLDKPLIWYEHPVISLKKQVLATVHARWANPVSSLVAGLLLGTRESFPEQTLEEFRRSGVTHIIALSGFNITILVVFFERLLLSLYLPKKWRVIVTVAAILSFTILVGAGPSIVRAAIMGGVVVVGKYLARQIHAFRIMLLTAGVMVLFEPFILLYDLGFQLSFLATLGLMLFTPWLEEQFYWVPEMFELRTSLASTLAASIPTLPLLVYQFEALSVVSPLTNMLILPLIPLTMAFGAVTVAGFWLHVPVALFETVAALFGQYVLSVSKWGSGFSWAFIEPEDPAKMALYCTMFVLCLYLLMLYETTGFSGFVRGGRCTLAAKH